MFALVLLLLSAPVAGRGSPGQTARRHGFSPRRPVASPNRQWDRRRQSVRGTISLEKVNSWDCALAAPDDGDAARIIRGGGNLDATRTQDNFLDDIVRTVLNVFTTGCRVVLPPVVSAVRAVTMFYAILPVDACLAQAGLVYAFAGGYYPTLFAALQAARHCGWEVMVGAVNDLAEEAVAAIQACDFRPSRGFHPRTNGAPMASGKILTQKTKIVLATIDPMKINQAVAALYTTWMGVSTVLEREFAKTIALSVTIADYVKPITDMILAPPAYRCVPRAYHKWVPVILGWSCKAVAMSVAWRIQRVLTAYTSAIAGGQMFSRSCFRMLRKRGVRLFGLIPEDCDRSYLVELIGFTIAAFGLYSQIGDGFDFEIPFPINLVTWPFGLAERWIQWQITKKGG